MRRICWIAIVAFPLLAQDRPAGKGVNFYSLEKEAALGQQLATEVARTTKPLDSAGIRDHVNALRQRLAAAVSGPAFRYSFRVLASGADNATHEPLALPGGYVFVPASLLLAAQDETEFAAAPPLSFLQVQRDNELEADRLATRTMTATGFDPRGLVRYIGRVQPEAGERPWAFSPLPSRSQRVGALEEVVRALPAHVTVAGDAFQAIQEQVRPLMSAPAEKRPPTLRQ